MSPISGFDTEQLRGRRVAALLKTRKQVAERPGNNTEMLAHLDRQLALYGHEAKAKPKRAAKTTDSDTPKADKPAKATGKKAPAKKTSSNSDTAPADDQAS